MTSIKNKTVRYLAACAFVILLGAADLTAETFSPVGNDISDNITGIHFIAADTGFLVTHAGQVGITYDAGRIWRMMTISPDAILEDVSFLNNRLGLVSGRNGALFVTRDGGRRWEDRSLPDTLEWLLSVQWIDSARAIAVGMTRNPATPLAGLSLITSDGGRSWQRQESMGLGYGDLYLSPGGPVYFQSYGKLHMSRDSGQTWRTVKTLDGTPGRATAIIGRIGVLAGAGGRIMYSHDNGRSWNDASTEITNPFTCLRMLNTDTGYVAGLGGIVMKTTDGGVTWISLELDESLRFDIYDMDIAGDQLFLVGQYGTILRARIR